VLFELPPVSSAADAAKAAAALLEAVAVGDLTPAEASELGKLKKPISRHWRRRILLND
jgi:hypothetical protein